MAEVEDCEFYQNINLELDHIAQHLSEWLKIKLLREGGKNWWKKNVYQVLDENSRHRIDCEQWKDIEDLDLHALLKVFDRNFNFLWKPASLPRDSRQIIKDMTNVRSRCQGHRPARGNRLLDLERDINTMRRFCNLIGMQKSTLQKLGELYNQISLVRLQKKGVIPLQESIPAIDLVSGSILGATPNQEEPEGNVRAFRKSLKETLSCAELTKSQTEAVTQLDDFLQTSDDRCFILKGYAGTGKTFIIGELVRYLQQHHIETVVMAPTGRAANVISTRHQISAGTIHRTIYAMDNLQEYKEVDKNGDLTFKFYYGLKNNDAQHDSVFIVDEASMLSDVYSEMEFMRFGSGRLLRDLLEYINFDANDYHKKIIFVGDNAQLAPVDMNHSPALNPKYLEKECRLDSRDYELLDVVRQDNDSLVLKNATMMRDLLAKDKFPGFDFKTDESSVSEVPVDEFMNRFVKNYKTNPNAELVIIGYSNELVGSYNKAVRARLFSDQIYIVADDRVVVIRNNYSNEIDLFNGQQGIVLEVDDQVETRSVPLNVGLDDEGKRRNEIVSVSFRDAIIEFTDVDKNKHQVKCKIIDDLLNSMSKELSSKQTKALYVDFKKRHPNLSHKDPLFRNALISDPYFNALQVKYGYAVTCHKAQGGEWDSVFIDFQGRNSLTADALRWSYTALTRSRSKVVATNALHHDMIKLVKKKKPLRPDIPEMPVENIAVLPPESCTDLPEELLGTSAVVKQIYRMVTSCLGEGWVFSKMKHCNYLEQYLLHDKEQTCLLKIHYKGNNTISNVRIENASGDSILLKAEAALDTLKGQKIRLNNPIDPSEEKKLLLTNEHFRDFIANLGPKYAEAGIQVIDIVEYDQYHLKLVIAHNGLNSSIDYYFNKKHMFTHITSHPSTDAGTEQLINSIHSN